VRDVRAEHARLAAAGVPITLEPATESWGLIEMWIEDPDGLRIVWSRFAPITLSAVTRDRLHRQGDEPVRHINRIGAFSGPADDANFMQANRPFAA
jgi:hypothetical protein